MNAIAISGIVDAQNKTFRIISNGSTWEVALTGIIPPSGEQILQGFIFQQERVLTLKVTHFMGINSLVLAGAIGTDTETDSKGKTTLQLAVRINADRTDWYQIAGTTEEIKKIMTQNCHKSGKIVVQGSLSPFKYNKKQDGKLIQINEIIASQITLIQA
jgi:Single-strand binding protein family